MTSPSFPCAQCGKEASRLVDGKLKKTVWCTIKCQNLWIDSFKQDDKIKKHDKKNKSR